MSVPVWNPAVEFMEREALERLQLTRLRQTVAWALKTPFYRRRLAEVGLTHPEDLGSLRDLRKLPIPPRTICARLSRTVCWRSTWNGQCACIRPVAPPGYQR